MMTEVAKQDVGGAELEVGMVIAMATSTAVGQIVVSMTTETRTGIGIEVSIYLLSWLI